MKQTPSSAFALLACLALVTGATVTKPPVPPKAIPLKRLPSSRSVAIPGEVNILISWDYPVADNSADLTFRIFTATNSVAPNWVLVTNVTGPTTQVMLPVVPGVHLFTVKTYSTFWGIESDAATPAQTPPAPSPVSPKINRAP